MPKSHVFRWQYIALAILLIVAALPLAIGGLQLVTLGGSWYYLLAALGLIGTAVLIALRDVRSVALFAIVFLCTVVWSLWEADGDFWPLVPRLAPFLVMGIIMALIYAALSPTRRIWGYGAALVMVVVSGAGIAAMFVPQGVVSNPSDRVLNAQATNVITDAASPANRWTHYGREASSTHYAPLDQINLNNVSSLEVAWTFQTGESDNPGSEYQAIPTHVGDTLYLCTPHNRVFALNAETGEERWSYDPEARVSNIWDRCRGVSYFDPAKTPAPSQTGVVGITPMGEQSCGARIITTTVDARMIAVDARTGEPCVGFGNNGIVDLTVGLGDNANWYWLTSQPLIADGHVVVGGWVMDLQSVDEPSGVVRAFDAATGELVWAWDMGNEAITKLPPPGQTYTRSTPNFWGTGTFDPELGLVYLPTGNQSADYWGEHRSDAADEHSSAVVALDVNTGRKAWVYQMVHHDLWDYDNAAAPTLVDFPDGKGGTIPALIQVTKTAEIFVLDRRTGTPITAVEERPVSQDATSAARLSPTQPFSVGMPYVSPQTLEEKDMWGFTFYDQLICRIEFKKLRYEGKYTPFVEGVPTLMWPGFWGGMNWGGVAVDEARNIMLVNEMRNAHVGYLVKHEDTVGYTGTAGHGGHLGAQVGAPYASMVGLFNSPLGIPCQEPPFGTISGIDLDTQEIAWQRPLGTAQDVFLGGFRVNVPVPIGMPSLSTAVTTASGLAFYAGTLDYYLRAWNTATGEEVWKARLPVGSQAAPMSYLSPESGRQFVVVVAGGARENPEKGDYVIGYALPKD